FVFFFSSRRRHTRFSRDWSSDVCSSDLVEISEDLLQERQRLRAVLDGPAAERGEERRGVHVERARSFAQEVAMTAGAGALELRLEQSEHLADAPADPARMAGRLAVASGEHPRDRQRKSARALRRDPRLDDGEPTAPTEPALSRDLVEQTKRANPRLRLGGQER